jgi:hypothetical protein
MDILGGHLLHDQATRQLFAGPYLQDEDTKTPSKERGGPFDPNSFSDDLAPPKMPPTKPTPRGIERPNVPLLGAPQSLQIQPQPPMPGEVPSSRAPGENGAPPMGMMPPPMQMLPFAEPRMPAPPPPMLRRPPAPKTNVPTPGLKGPPPTPHLKSPAPVSHSPSSKPPSSQSKTPSKPSSPKPSGEGAPKSPKSRLSAFYYLNSVGENEQPGGMPNAPPMMPSEPPVPPIPGPPTQQQGLPSVGDFDASPDWGRGDGSGSHISDEGPDWGGLGLIDDPDWNSAHRADGGPDGGSHPQMDGADFNTARRKGFMFTRLSLRR